MMNNKVKSLIKHGFNLAIDINADILLIFTETGRTYEYYKDQEAIYKRARKNRSLKDFKSLKVVVTTPNEETFLKLKNESKIIPLLMTYRNDDRSSMIKQAVTNLFANNIVKKGDIVVSILGIPKVTGGTDTISIFEVNEYPQILKYYDYISSIEKTKGKVINEVLNLCMELAVEGREGTPVGSIFVIGDSDRVLKMSSQLILNPFEGHESFIFDKQVKGTVKELSTIDGAFVIGEKGEVLCAGRYISCSGGNIELPLGLGARHHAAATISKYTGAIAITISESGGVIRIFKNGEILSEIKPKKLSNTSEYSY
ncbi:DNA integrity scanning protein DisA with diadenylate cyclase activity [Methanococcus maripaludis]|uniref:Diadenylate cyclase n=1 Tax=Methanococcus maripaludis TaxID=39152 RepID=A0A7J9NYL0_METMI|nr:diadenylate cyclase [Methanococcus maripaludis]MBA2839738.1 DNA integrity scanning protein DisA with diadenylate cyclase activity [Methanococcus maripaludis]MBA2852315.1 DNA integrity scanning protein DisA with diadenylate cyclase activity [Methanococcus maripaludis]MBA2859456.1 DNA integrity scanning protein DisA with diadenylate cyclase activity [Methanococcus maripaludis]MBA2868093.1 DNA integrity scanning protein DisA with diadenylate cyclase activity [Methanococcus maripaludis]MBB64013